MMLLYCHTLNFSTEMLFPPSRRNLALKRMIALLLVICTWMTPAISRWAWIAQHLTVNRIQFNDLVSISSWHLFCLLIFFVSLNSFHQYISLEIIWHFYFCVCFPNGFSCHPHVTNSKLLMWDLVNNARALTRRK